MYLYIYIYKYRYTDSGRDLQEKGPALELFLCSGSSNARSKAKRDAL